jgi:hypothetical protein
MSEILKPVLEKQKSKLKSSYVISSTLPRQSPEGALMYSNSQSNNAFGKRRGSNKALGTRLPAISPMSNNSTSINSNIQKFLNTNTSNNTTIQGGVFPTTDRENGPSANDRY